MNNMKRIRYPIEWDGTPYPLPPLVIFPNNSEIWLKQERIVTCPKEEPSLFLVFPQFLYSYMEPWTTLLPPFSHSWINQGRRGSPSSSGSSLLGTFPWAAYCHGKQSKSLAVHVRECPCYRACSNIKEINSLTFLNNSQINYTEDEHVKWQHKRDSIKTSRAKVAATLSDLELDKLNQSAKGLQIPII